MRNTALCSRFCFYHKPDKNEEFACKGHDVVERLLQQGRKISFHNPGEKADRAIVEKLVKEMCAHCRFFEHDCDFMRDRSAPSCGGFILLAQLLASGELMLVDIR